MICRHCGGENRESASFCQACGTPISAQPTPVLAPRNKTAIVATILVVIATAFCILAPTKNQSTVKSSRSSSTDQRYDPRYDRRNQAACMSNMMQISLATIMYVYDYDGTFPPPNCWPDATQPYLKNIIVLACPSRPDLKVGYAFNANMARRNISQISVPVEAVMFFESNLGNLSPADSGTSYLLNAHFDSSNVAFSDGHVKSMKNKPSGSNVWLDSLPPLDSLPAGSPPPSRLEHDSPENRP